MEAIRCEGLTKRYGDTVAVDHLDLCVEPGQVYGFLGPNGAGKTSTIRMLLGLVAPSAGRAWLLGRPLPAPDVVARVGALVEEPAFYPWMTGRANLEVLVPAERVGVSAALDIVGLTAVADAKVKTYSQGMRQRLGLAAALVGRPDLVIVDEPTNGLDPAGIRDVRGILRDTARAGATVFVSSHLLAEVEHVCDRAAVVVRGRLVEEGPPTTLGAGARRVRVAVRRSEARRAVSALGAWSVTVEGAELVVDHAVGRDVNGVLAAAGIIADSVVVEQPDLEARYLALVSDAGR